MYKIIFIFFIGSVYLYSQINSERPGYSNPPQTVPEGKVQWENGFDLTYQDGFSGDYNINIINSLLRYGINDFSEIRFSTLYNRSDKFNIGSNQIAFGAKACINESQDYYIPTSGLIFNLALTS
ncbi:MAG TPA: hypothetical protein PLE30_05760 [Candidatus Kapabacteria bacterium]|nr:hypothetical protein [Candidatus Kapabacteria bacterium]